MVRTLRTIFSQDKEKFTVPKSVQQIIPVQTIWEDGIFRVGKNKYSKTFKFTDINYSVASLEDKKTMLRKYIALLSSLDSSTTTKLTLNNRKMNREDLEKNVMIPLAGDDLDLYRKEYNAMLLAKGIDSNRMVQEKYLTVSVYKKTVEEARSTFKRMGTELQSHFSHLGSRFSELDAKERLRSLHDFYRDGEENFFDFDIKHAMKKGHSFKDFICPDSMEFHKNHFRMGEKFGRVLFLRDYANYIKDDILAELTSLNRNLMLSIDIISVPTDEGIREVENRILGVETNITNWQRKQNENHNFSAMVPYDMEQARQEARDIMEDLTVRDMRMTYALLTIVHTADSKEQLDMDTDTILSIGRNKRCHISVLNFQQMDGLNTVLPIGVRKINAMRTLITESLAAFMPFRVQEIMDRGGIYIGDNAISNNMLLCNKEKLLNPNSFLLGVPGSGKSFFAKMLIIFIALATDDDILICDPEGEYVALIREMKGQVIRIAAGSDDHINAMDMVDGYGDNRNPVIEKSQFILSLFEQLETERGLTARDKSIIDRCTREVYEDYKKTGKVPTLITLREKLLQQEEQEAHDLALSMELFTNGSLNVFAHETNVDIHNRMVVYDILDLGEQLKKMGLLVITDAMLNRVTENWKKGKRTHLFIDEYHVVFEDEYSGAFFNSAWRRFRKRNAFPTAITQNVDFILDSPLAKTMISNSEFIVMLNQAAQDRDRLASLLNISNEQLGYVTDAEAGCGLIRYGSSLVPFVNKFPKNTKLYELMNTKPSEKNGYRPE